MKGLDKGSVLVLGYSPLFGGGVSKVTNILVKNMQELELHPVLLCYRPRILSVIRSALSFVNFLIKIIFRIGRYKIIHIIIGSPGDAVRTVPFIWVARILKVRTCNQYHKSADIIINGISVPVVKKIIFRTWNKVGMHAFLSKRLADLHKELVSEDIRFTVIPNALDDLWLDSEILTYNKRSRDIVFFGRWSWEKGVDDLTRAMREITSKATCEIYTDLTTTEKYKNCKILPWAKEERVFEIMRTAKLLILPSYSEAFPTVLLEAIACGTPFIATEIAGIPDIAEQSGGGLLIKPGDIEALAKNIDLLLKDNQIWVNCSNSGKSWVKQLNIESITKQWRDTYNTLTA